MIHLFWLIPAASMLVTIIYAMAVHGAEIVTEKERIITERDATIVKLKEKLNEQT